MRPICLALLVALPALLLAGCDTTDSCVISTPGFFVIYHVLEEGDRATVTAEFHVDNRFGNFVMLGDCDEITVNDTILTYSAELLEFPQYKGRVSAAEEYQFELKRTGEDPIVSTVSAPEPVTIAAPAEDAMISRQDGVTISWTDPDTTSAMDYLVYLHGETSDCTHEIEQFVTDVTSVTFTAESFMRVVEDGEGNPTGETEPVCSGSALEARLTVDSQRNGTLDSSLHGTIEADTRTTTMFTILP